MTTKIDDPKKKKKKRRNGDELPVWGPIEQHELHWEGGPMGATGKHGQK